MRAPLSGLARPVLLAQRHQAGHLFLGHADLLAAQLGQREVLHLECGELGARVHVVLSLRLRLLSDDQSQLQGGPVLLQLGWRRKSGGVHHPQPRALQETAQPRRLEAQPDVRPARAAARRRGAGNRQTARWPPGAQQPGGARHQILRPRRRGAARAPARPDRRRPRGRSPAPAAASSTVPSRSRTLGSPSAATRCGTAGQPGGAAVDGDHPLVERRQQRQQRALARARRRPPAPAPGSSGASSGRNGPQAGAAAASSRPARPRPRRPRRRTAARPPRAGPAAPGSAPGCRRQHSARPASSAAATTGSALAAARSSVRVPSRRASSSPASRSGWLLRDLRLALAQQLASSPTVSSSSAHSASRRSRSSSPSRRNRSARGSGAAASTRPVYAYLRISAICSLRRRISQSR